MKHREGRINHGIVVCRSSISFETSKPPREHSFDNFREIGSGAAATAHAQGIIDIGRVFDSNKKEIARDAIQ